MGAKSTQFLTRKQCKRKIKDRMKQMSDKELEDLCEHVVGNEELHNYSIVSQDELDRRNAEEKRVFDDLHKSMSES